MAARGDKVSVNLNAEIVARTRKELGAGAESDAAVVERAFNAYLLGRLVDATQANAGLPEEEAGRLTHDELHAARCERGAA